MKQPYNTALYMRLSRDDEKYGDSVSIETQRTILRQFAKEQNLHAAGDGLVAEHGEGITDEVAVVVGTHYDGDFGRTTGMLCFRGHGRSRSGSFQFESALFHQAEEIGDLARMFGELVHGEDAGRGIAVVGRESVHAGDGLVPHIARDQLDARIEQEYFVAVAGIGKIDVERGLFLRREPVAGRVGDGVHDRLARLGIREPHAKHGGIVRGDVILSELERKRFEFGFDVGLPLQGRHAVVGEDAEIDLTEMRPCGFKQAAGRVVFTMDADLQDSPEELPEMYRMVTKEGWDIVSGWKQHRQDNKLTKNLPSKLYNATARAITGIKLHDMNCGLKAYANEVVKSIEVYGEMHRYIPYLAKNAGYTRITEKPVHHQKRKYGVSKFGLERFVNGFLDLLSLWFLSTFGKKPMHFFGYTGLFMFLVGFVMTIWIIVAKLVHQASGTYYRAVTDQPLFYLALLTVVLGVMLFLAGLIGEMISRSSSDRNNYNISDTI